MIVAPEWMVEPAPISTSSPIVAPGCTSTSAASRAPGLTVAAGLMPIRGAGAAGESGSRSR